VIVFQLSKAWGWYLLAIQVLNGVAAALAVFAMKLPPDTQVTVLGWNAAIAGAVGGVQAFTKSLSDTDGDGTPDLFDATPNGPPPGAG
jgi:hypothetical protein